MSAEVVEEYIYIYRPHFIITLHTFIKWCLMPCDYLCNLSIFIPIISITICKAKMVQKSIPVVNGDPMHEVCIPTQDTSRMKTVKKKQEEEQTLE